MDECKPLIIGPVSIAAFYVLLQSGVNVQGALALFGASAGGAVGWCRLNL